MPLHKNRTWVVNPAPSAEWLAEQLIGRSWCSCCAWSLGGYLFLNDQTSPDGAFEVAILKPPAEPDGQWWQVETVTYGWFLERPASGWESRRDYERDEGHARRRAASSIEGLISGGGDPGREGSVAWEVDPPRLETPEQHGRCGHCA